MKMETDVVVIGGGLAGFVAALSVAEAGKQVVLLEKQSAFGGSSVLSGGSLAFAGTDLQLRQGIQDSDDLLFQDLREVGANENDERLVRVYVENQLATYQWLTARGTEFSPLVPASSGQSVPRCHNTDPADLVRLLVRHCEATGRVNILTSTRALRLVRDPVSNRVAGVSAESDTDMGCEQIEIESRRGVALCSGGFSRNAELIHKFMPDYDQALFTGGAGNIGDGLKMAWRLGADFRDVAYIKGTFGKHPTDENNLHSCCAFYKGAIIVNTEGKRFVDESISYKLLGDACLRQPYASAFQILDQDIFESGDNRVRIMDFERRLEDGLMLKAASLAELASMIDLPADVLSKTVAEYNGFVDAGQDPHFGRAHLVHKYGALRRIERAPFYAYPSTTIVFGTYCGLCVDPKMRVLDVFGDPIVGLFAAGEVVGGLHGAGYMTGSSLGKSAIFGRVAARSLLGRDEVVVQPSIAKSH